MTPPRQSRPGASPPVVAALGVTQIIGYGAIYYAYPILVPAIAADFGTGQPLLYGLLSLGLLLGGFAAPGLGGLVDRLGAARVMTAGSLATAVLTAALAMAPGLIAFAALVLLIEALSFAVLYDAAFAALAQKRPADTRRAITRLTLIAGFASTLFWPLTGWLVQDLGWRGTCLLFAGLHLGIAAPLHLWIARAPVAGGPDAAADPSPPDPAAFVPAALTPDAARRAFVLLGVGFALTGMAIAALGVHLVPVLLALDLGHGAYLVAMAMGPAQVAVRLVDATMWRDVHPLAVAILAAAALPLALGFLLLPGPATAMALAFAVMFGAGGGLSSIVRGAVPVALFGTAGIGRRLGRLAAIRSVLGAAAPFLFAWAAAGLGTRHAVAMAMLVAGGGLAAMLVLHLRLARDGIVPPIGRRGARLR